eukprot:9487032-Pyramimonas_sp.AAC.1
MCRRRKRVNETWGDYWSSRIRHARILLLSSSRPSLVQLTLYRQWMFAQHVVCTAFANLAQPARDSLSQGILSREPELPHVLCDSPVPPTPAPVQNRRKLISDMYRNVRRRREEPSQTSSQPISEPP